MAQRIIIALSILIGTAIVLIINWPGVLRPPAEPAPQSTSEGAPKGANIGGAFALIDTDGNAVTEASLKGHYSLIYFGFTRCPDICPVTLQKMTEALQIAGNVGEKVVPVFITVDPEHDTPAVMKDYVANFGPRILALTGTPDAIKSVESAYRVYAKTGEDNTGTVHGDLIYLMDADGRYVTQISSDATAADIANRLRTEIKTP